MNFIFIKLLLLIAIYTVVSAQERHFVVRDSFIAPEVRQGVAVDENYIYVIGTQQIAKYSKREKKFIKKWKGAEDGPIIHLDSGVIIDGKLYCSHSNYPGVPMTSSIEVWDSEKLEHIESHSFGINWGSCTWIDRLNGYWYATFAHYNKLEDLTGKGVEWTLLVKFDDDWSSKESWTYPKEVTDKFGRMSNSGGSFGTDGLLYLSGHDAPELYIVKFPEKGSVMELVESLPINNTGQGIAWDRSNSNYIYTIKKKERLVIRSELVNK